MVEVFKTALEQLTSPLAIIAIMLMFSNIVLILAFIRYLTSMSKNLGRLTATVEFLVYQNNTVEGEDKS